MQTLVLPLQSTDNCTVGTCPLSCAQVEYLPTLAGNAVYAAASGLLLIAQLAATADDHSGSETGMAIMVAGVVFQVRLAAHLLGIVVGIHIPPAQDEWERQGRTLFVELRDTKKFTWFQYALGAAVVLIFIRSVYRVAELAARGFNGPIANDEVSSMILEGSMIFLAVLAMTVLHPGIAFGGRWSSAAWSVKQSRKAAFATSSSSMEDIHLQQRYNP